LDIFLEPSDENFWVYRRDVSVKRLRAEMVSTSSGGVPHLNPEGVLLFKAGAMREKDEADFAACLPLMQEKDRIWLKQVLERTRVERDHIYVVPPDHDLASRTTVRMRDLEGHPLLLGPQGTAFRSDLDRAADRAGIVLTPKIELDGLRLIASLAFEGFGAAVVPSAAIPFWLVDSDAFRMVPIEDAGTREVSVARRRRGLPSAPARALQQAMVDVLRAQSSVLRGVHPSSAEEQR